MAYLHFAMPELVAKRTLPGLDFFVLFVFCGSNSMRFHHKAQRHEEIE
jgi:hypothetical protein